MLTRTDLLIQFAHCGKNQAVNILWKMYGDDVMNAALAQAYIQQSDFSHRGLSAEERRRDIMGDIYLKFHRLVYKFDPTRNDDFLGFVIQYITWHTQSVKRTNSIRADREKYDQNITKFPTPVEFDKVMDTDYDFKKLVNLIRERIEKKPSLKKSLEEYYKACEAMEKGEIIEVANKMGYTRATVYNHFKAIWKILQEDTNKQLVDEIWYALAA